ncbi:hypothetical protein ACFW1M_08495 [Streptomyces inhibens]|uniref:hypothetical protein n=1 Tax=Streptomyces inhibens TaxID=2293571 RepID=UPI00367B5236
MRYGRFTAVENVDLLVPEGTVTGLIGGSASGKSDPEPDLLFADPALAEEAS